MFTHGQMQSQPDRPRHSSICMYCISLCLPFLKVLKPECSVSVHASTLFARIATNYRLCVKIGLLSGLLVLGFHTKYTVIKGNFKFRFKLYIYIFILFPCVISVYHPGDKLIVKEFSVTCIFYFKLPSLHKYKFKKFDCHLLQGFFHE